MLRKANLLLQSVCLILLAVFAGATSVLAQQANPLPAKIVTTVTPIAGDPQTNTQSGTLPGTSASSQICELVEWATNCRDNVDKGKLFQNTKLCCTFSHPDGTLQVTCDDGGIIGVEIEHPETCELVSLAELCAEYLSERPFDDYAALPAYIRNYCETFTGNY